MEDSAFLELQSASHSRRGFLNQLRILPSPYIVPYNEITEVECGELADYQIVFTILSALMLFLFGLGSFSHELRQAAGGRLKTIMERLTVNRFVGCFVGFAFTAVIQSSTAVSALAVSLVDGGILSFSGALAIMLGSYIGTTTTAWLVSFKLTSIGPFFIVLGTVLTWLPFKIRIFGKALFYFGFIFFSLDLISTSLAPLRESPQMQELLLHTHSPLMGLLIGIILTVILQSSTVVTGLAIVFVQQTLLLPEHSIPIVLGANIGTTATALLASVRMSRTAKKAAMSNTIINTVGVLLIFPFLRPFTHWVLSVAATPSLVVAIAHLSFNVALVSLFLFLLTPFTRLMNRLYQPSP